MSVRLRSTLVSIIALVFAACGGTSGSSPASSTTNGPSGTAATPAAVSGTITGFGSVYLDGLEYGVDSAATVSDNTDPANPVAETLDALQVGQHVDTTCDGSGNLATIGIGPSLAGPIDAGSIDPNDAGSKNTLVDSFTVLGQTVTFTPSGTGATLFVGVTDSSQLKDGQMVVVHGPVSASGVVSATLIVVLPTGTQPFYRVRGVVQNTNTTAQSFALGTLTVDYGTAKIVPSGATIQNGESVVVFTNVAPIGTSPNLTLTATTVGVFNASIDGILARLGGPVTAVTPVTGQAIPNFTVDGISVDASKATLEGGATASEIQVGALVRVDGTLTQGTLDASEISVVPPPTEHQVVLVGEVTDFVSVSSFVVRGATVDASSATYTNGTSSQLADGVFVQVTGHVSGADVVADQITFVTPPQGITFTVTGTVSNYNAKATPPTFTLLGLSMELDPKVTYSGGTATQFVNGALVQVTGSFSGTVFDVTRVEFATPLPTPVLPLSGVLTDLTPATGTPTSFVINNATVTVTSSTVITNGPLADGQHVDVLVQPGSTASSLVALNVIVLTGAGSTPGPVNTPATGVGPTQTTPVVRLFGAITSFTSISSFVVDDQTVDASSATLTPSGTTASDLAVGKIVAVTGTLSSGVVTATAVLLVH